MSGAFFPPTYPQLVVEAHLDLHFSKRWGRFDYCFINYTLFLKKIPYFSSLFFLHDLAIKYQFNRPRQSVR